MSFAGETIDVRKGGTTFNNEVRGVPVTYDGKPHLLTISRDVTESRQAQAEMEKLLKVISTSNVDLIRSNEKLERSNKELARFSNKAAKRIYDSYDKFRKRVTAWHDILEREYLNIR